MEQDRFERTANGIRIDVDGGTVAIEPVTSRIVRTAATEGTPVPAMGEHSPIIETGPDESVAWEVTSTPECVSLRTDGVRVDVSVPEGRLSWRDPKTGRRIAGQPADETWSLRDVRPADLATDDSVASPRTSLDRQAYSWRLPLSFREEEAILGLGQHEGGVASYRGESQHLYQANTKVAMPSFLSTGGYGMLWDCSSLSIFRDDQHGTYLWAECADALDCYFVFGPEPTDVIAGFRRLIGRPSMLPRWSYGYVQSKERYETAEELLEVVQEYRDREIPIDCIVQDWQYWPDSTADDPDFASWGGPAGDWGQWGQKSFHRERYPDPSGLLEELHDRGVRLMISIWPNALAGENHDELRAGGHLIDDAAVDAPANEQRYYNVFSPDARKLYWRQAKEGLFEHGVDAWWCDSTEPFDPDWTYPLTPDPARRAAHATDQLRAALDPGYVNAYSIYQARTMYEGQRAATEDKRVLNLTRSGSPGQHRYGAITWSGDVEATWERFRKQIADGLQFTATGNPRWTLDIGGFFVNGGPSWIQAGDYDDGVEDLGYRELYVRWLQFGAFLPMMRSHGTDTPREVWRFGDPGDRPYETIKRFIEFRYRLLPYIYAVAGHETVDDATMIRHLALDFPDDRAAHDVADQFLFGPNLMVCPVTEPMYYGPDSRPLNSVVRDEGWRDTAAAEARTVYLPDGVEWFDFWTGRRYEGGQELVADAPLDKLPLYVRAGSILPLGPVVQHSGAASGSSWSVRVYPGANGNFGLYEDGGDGYAYEAGEYAITPMEWDDGSRTLTLRDRDGSFPALPETRTVTLSTVSPGVATGIGKATPQAAVTYRGRETTLSPDEG